MKAIDSILKNIRVSNTPVLGYKNVEKHNEEKKYSVKNATVLMPKDTLKK